MNKAAAAPKEKTTMISLKSIRTSASSASYTRGNQVYKQGKVQDLHKTEDREVIYVSANVDGFYHERSVFTPKSQEILTILEQYVLHEREVMRVYNRRYAYSYHSYHYYDSGSVETLTKRKLSLTDEWMARFAEVLTGESCGADLEGKQVTLTFEKGNPLLKTSVKIQEEGG